MENLSVQSTGASAAARPVGLQPDLAALLQDGRVLAGQVLDTFGGGSILLAVGRHRVPAQSQVEMHVGDRFLFQVEANAAQLVLHILGQGAGEPELIQALRAAVGEDRPVARLLQDLAVSLRAQLAGGDPDGPDASRLLQDLASHVFRPGSEGTELETLLQRSGLRYEAALAAAGKREGGPPAPTLRGLATLWAQAWSKGSTALGPDDERVLERQLLRALSEAVSQGREKGLGETVDRLRAALGRLAKGLPAGGARAALERGATGLDLASLSGTREGSLLARVLGLDAGVDPRQLAQWSAQAALADLEHDLKGFLLRARGVLPEGSSSNAVVRALAGLEAEQLLNLARREAHDAWHWSFPVPDGDSWRTAHLFYRSGRDQDGAEGEAEGGQGHRFVLGIELSQLGAVRAELLFKHDLLGVRVTVTRAEVAARLRTDLVELRDRLALNGLRVHLSVVHGTAAEASIDPLLTDIHYLHENHLLDLSG